MYKTLLQDQLGLGVASSHLKGSIDPVRVMLIVSMFCMGPGRCVIEAGSIWSWIWRVYVVILIGGTMVGLVYKRWLFSKMRRNTSPKNSRNRNASSFILECLFIVSYIRWTLSFSRARTVFLVLA